MKKKVGILTFHWVDNYGALLQCYALQRLIADLDYECFVLNYIPSRLKENNKLFHCNLSTLLKDIVFFRRHFLRRMHSNWFRKQFLVLADKDIGCDNLVVGSDQIWNLPMTDGDKGYFGFDIQKKQVPIIAYAASMGADLSNEWEERFFHYLKNIARISVREESARDYIARYSDVSVDVVLDPVFLLSKKDWLNIIPAKRLIAMPYVFVYSVDNGNKEFIQIVNKVSALLNLGVVCSDKSLHKSKNYKRIIKTFGTGGPLTFLNYLLNASFVVTSSFHGTAFSLILEKDFISVSPSSNASRLVDLLERLNCSHRMITNVSDLNEKLIKEKNDYSAVYNKISIELEKSSSWLKQALNEN